MVPEKSSQPSLVVGIGASAGGLAPLKAFVRALPEDTDMAFVVVQHLDPTHKSLLPELLQNACRLKVAEVHDEDEMLAGHVYVMPQDTYLEVEHNRLRLVESEDTRGTRKAIDYFFRSLAAEFGDRCAGIVFSGAGGDGTAGLRAIKAAGGLSLAQDPEEAEHRSMPETALRANAVDKVAPVSELPALLSQFADHPLTFLGDVRDNKPSEADDPGKSLMEIASILRTNENFDLRQYKASTVQRRIARRMSLTGQGAYADYLDLLRDSPQERNQLTQDLLINVTDFFRDREAFDLLRKEVFPKIVDNLDGDEPLRLWVAGCASGEEAYSLGILGLEAMAAARKKNDIRIFATDIDEHAIRIARRGFYPDSIAREVPGEYLETYFNKSENDHYYKVRGFLRDLISFAHQNVATDPPFNHMHLISCRNLLIYLKREAQEQILNSFYFALDGPSYLFLGSSESLGNRGELFRTVSKKWRIYQKIPHRDIRRDIKRRMRVDVAENLEDYQTAADADDSVDQHERAPAAGRRRNREMTRADQIRLAVMEAATPPCVVVDEQGQILFSHGDVRPFMVIPQGEPSTEVTQYLLPSMRSRIRSGLFKVRKNQQRGTVHCAMDEGADETTKRMVRVELVPMPRQDFVDGLAVSIVFHEAGRTDTPDISYTPDEDARAYADLEQELAETREELQNTLEELDTSTEELKASHEEALSTNEELQSSNEELEASSEELRSLNEELRTVNAQLKEKIDELKRANNDAENFFASTGVPTLFLDPDLCIQRYTPAAERLLHMGPRDLERPITELDRELLNEALPEQCRSVLDDFQPVRREIRDPGRRRWYLRQITPYRTDDRHIEGVVILFQDITELKALTDRAKSRERQQAAVAKLGLLALRSVDLEELMHQAVRQVARTLNADYCKVLQHHPEQHLLRMVAGVGWREGLVGKATVPDDQDSQAGYTLLSREPVITQLAEEKRFDSPALLTEHDVASGMSCVINHSQPAYGVIGVHCRDVREFTVDDANFLQSVANMLSTALQQRTHQSALHESENRFRTMANSIPQLAWMTDETGYIFWYNQRWYDYTGTTLEDMQGWGWQKIHHPNHIERVVRIIKHSFDTGEAWEDTFPLRGKDGQYRWFLSRALPIRDEHGKIVRWFGTNTDITENLEKEAALRASERKLRLAKDAARLGLFDYDIPNESISWDPLLHEIWGVDLETPVTYDLALGGLHPDDRAPAEAAVLRALAPSGDGLYNITYRVINARTGKVSSVNASGTTEFVDGKPVRMVGLVNDVTEIYEAREAIARSEYRLRLAKESARLGMFDYDIVNNRIEWDPLLREIWGIAPDETVTFETFSRGLPPEDLAHTQAAIDRSFDPEGDRHFEATYRVVNAKTQELFWVHASGQVEFEQGRAVRMIGLVNDITHQENTRTQLANSEHRLRLAKDAARLAVFDFDMVNDRVEWDERMGEIWGIPRTNHITLADAFGSIHPDDHEKVRAEVERSCNPDGDGYYACTYRVINQRSERLHWISAFGVVHFKDRQPVRMIGLIDDVTDQEEIKQQLRAAITELQDTDRKKNDFLSILGHELRNPLAALSGCVQVLAEEVPEQGELLSIMHHSTRTMARLLDDLLDLKRVSSSTIELELEPLDLSELLNDISRIMRDRLTERKHRFEVVIEPGLTVLGDAVRLEQVFTNLLVNAAKYTPEGGDVILRAHREGDKVFVEVEDTGMGFAKGMASKLFDPFYQVKPDNQAASGLGIGLALSRKLVDLHGGTISTYSPGPGQGATFTVRLPLGKPAQNDTPQEPAQTAVANELKVLLVEDHESIRRMMPIQLQALGCQVETAANGEEGLSKAAEFQPDAVVLDIGLPDITGHEVGRRLRQRGYRGRLIALSGYSHEEVRAESAAAGFDRHLAKPASNEELARALNE